MKEKRKYNTREKTLPAALERAAVYSSEPVFRHFVINDEYALVKKAQEGLRTEVFYMLASEIKMSDKSLASVINLSPRTISNYHDQQKSLDATYSEHLLKLIRLYGLGEEIFGSMEELNLWMDRPFWNSVEKPIDLIATPGGVDLVHEEIEKLAQGYPL